MSYFGLNPRVRQSGLGPAHHGRISKIGRSHARAMLVEAAWAAAKAPGPLHAFFVRIRAKRGHQIAAVAVARKLAVLCWHVLTKEALEPVDDGDENVLYSVVRDRARDLRPIRAAGFEVRFETPPGEQAQVDFAQFNGEFADQPGVKRIVWLFSMVLGYSRLIWGRFVVHQDLQSVLRCHIAALEAIDGVPREILYDRMKTAVIGEDPDGLVVYNRALLDLARHYGFQPRACRPYRAKTKGKVERPFRYIREDFFLGGTFRNLDDLNGQLRHWLDTIANPRVHATTRRIVNEAFAEEKPALKPLPLLPYQAVLRLERRASHEGMVSVGGNLYSVPDTTRRRLFDVHVLADAIRIFEDGALVATRAPLEGRGEKRLDPAHRRLARFCRRRPNDPEPVILTCAGDRVVRRSLDFYEAVGRRLAARGGAR